MKYLAIYWLMLLFCKFNFTILSITCIEKFLYLIHSYMTLIYESEHLPKDFYQIAYNNIQGWPSVQWYFIYEIILDKLHKQTNYNLSLNKRKYYINLTIFLTDKPLKEFHKPFNIPN